MAFRSFLSGYQANEIVFVILFVKYQVWWSFYIYSHILELRLLSNHFCKLIFPPSLFSHMLYFFIFFLSIKLITDGLVSERKPCIGIDINLFVADANHYLLCLSFTVIRLIVIINNYEIRFITLIISVKELSKLFYSIIIIMMFV